MAEAAGFDVLVTGDQSMPHEQNLSGRKLAIVMLSAIERAIIKNHVAKIAAAVEAAPPRSFSRVECVMTDAGGPGGASAQKPGGPILIRRAARLRAHSFLATSCRMRTTIVAVRTCLGRGAIASLHVASLQCAKRWRLL